MPSNLFPVPHVCSPPVDAVSRFRACSSEGIDSTEGGERSAGNDEQCGVTLPHASGRQTWELRPAEGRGAKKQGCRL